MHRVKIGILGASGYVGGELIQRLVVHPGVELVFLGSLINAGRYVCHLFPHLRNGFGLEHQQFKTSKEFVGCDVLFSALPQGELPKLVENLASKVDKIFNIAGDYRINNPLLRKKYYPETTELSDNITTGYIIPEFSEIPNVKILNLPGCMAAAAIYSIMPLLKEGIVTGPLFIDAKTGSSGSGSKKANTHSERNASMGVHKLMGHRHGAEIENFISAQFNQIAPIVMATTSVDISRGVMVHVYGELKKLLDMQTVRHLYTQYYKPHRFIRFVNISGTPHGSPTTKAVMGTNYCEVSCAVGENTCQFTAVATLDNLVKGAAGNAIQLLNQLYKFPLEWGLNGFGVWP